MDRSLTRRRMIASGLAAVVATKAAPASRQYSLYKDGSTITFLFTTSGNTQTGTVPIDTADIWVNTADLARSSADVTADIRQVRTGLIFITQAIKSPELLDAANHPLVRFTSTEIRLGSGGRISNGAQIDGMLRLRGVTLPITLDATLSRPAGTATDALDKLYVQLTGGLSRADYGATGFVGLAEDRVDLDIRAEIRVRA